MNYLTSLVQDLVRVLETTHGSIQDAFASKDNHQQLDCFFALLHQSQFSPTTNEKPAWNDNNVLGQSVNLLPLPNDIKVCSFFSLLIYSYTIDVVFQIFSIVANLQCWNLHSADMG